MSSSRWAASGESAFGSALGTLGARMPAQGFAGRPWWRAIQRKNERHAESMRASVRPESPSACNLATVRRMVCEAMRSSATSGFAASSRSRSRA